MRRPLVPPGSDVRRWDLIDDRENNWQVFAEQGGTQVQYKMLTGEVADFVQTQTRRLKKPTARSCTVAGN
jgi:hypothetical protein